MTLFRLPLHSALRLSLGFVRAVRAEYSPKVLVIFQPLPLDESPAAESGGLSSALSVTSVGNWSGADQARPHAKPHGPENQRFGPDERTFQG